MRKPIKNGYYIMSVKDVHGSFKALIQIKEQRYRDIKYLNRTGKIYSGIVKYNTAWTSLEVLRNQEKEPNSDIKFIKVTSLAKLLYEQA
jgi:hypothetical protein